MYLTHTHINNLYILCITSYYFLLWRVYIYYSLHEDDIPMRDKRLRTEYMFMLGYQ